MFNCYNHGWSDSERSCPLCFPTIFRYSSSTSIIGHLEKRIQELERELEITKDNYKSKFDDWQIAIGAGMKFKDQLSIALEALKYIVKRGYTGAEYVAREALEKIGSVK